MFVAWCERECVLFVLGTCMNVCVRDREGKKEGQRKENMVLFVLLCFHQPRVPGCGQQNKLLCITSAAFLNCVYKWHIPAFLASSSDSKNTSATQNRKKVFPYYFYIKK